MDLKILTIPDEALPVVQKLLDAQNSTRSSAGDTPFTIDEFVQSELLDHFQIHPEQIKERSADDLASKVKRLDATDLAEIVASVDAKLAAKNP